MRPQVTFCLAVALLLPGTLTPVQAQDREGQPLSVIDWLGTRPPPPRPHLPAKVPSDEPAVADSALPPQVSVQPLGQGAPRETGLVPSSVTGLPNDIWTGSELENLVTLMESMPDLRLPAAQSLLYTVLLAEALAPRGDGVAGEALTLARVKTLMKRGAVDPALSLIEQAGVTRSPRHFDLWMDLTLLTGTEDRACALLASAPHLTRDYAKRIFCAARERRWEDAALTLGSAQALNLLPEWKLQLMDRFLNPDFYEDAAPLPPPRRMDPLSFRIFEAIGEAQPTGTLDRAFAVADLRDLAGWKAQLQAGERLTRAGALPDNSLLGLYSERQAAASGGVWDRVRALQNFDTALTTGSTEAVTKTLSPLWDALREEGLALFFVTIYAEQLQGFDLTGRAGRIAQQVGLLSPLYEMAAQGASERGLAEAVALGEIPSARPANALHAAIYDAFAEAAPRPDLVQMVKEKRLGETILRLLHLLHEGAKGDPSALRDALASLRAIGLEDSARRAALQLILLEEV